MSYTLRKKMKHFYFTLAWLWIGLCCASEKVNDPFQADSENSEIVGKISEFPEWTFCVAYNFRDGDERDARPIPKDDPFGQDGDDSEDAHISRGSLLIPDFLLDTAGLVSRTTSQKKIKKDLAQKIFDLTLKENQANNILLGSDCYDPHHIIVFYQDFGIPVGCIEVCFTCNRAKIYHRKNSIDPAVRVYPTSQPDFLAIATLLDQVGLPLTPYKSLADYKVALEEKVKREEQFRAGQQAPLSE